MLSMNGREHFVGRQLFDRLAAESEAALVGYAVVPPGREHEPIRSDLERDLVLHQTVRELAPSLIYLEGGLGSSADNEWRYPRPLLEAAVRDGAVAIVADADVRVLTEEKDAYVAAAGFLGARPDYGVKNEPRPVYGADLESHWGSDREIVLRPEQLIVDRWLTPVYESVTELLAVLPARLDGWTDLLASGNSTSGTLQNDVWIERYERFPFASVRALGDGFVVFIAAGVSNDLFLERCPDNATWLVNLARFLHQEVRRETMRRSPLRELQDAVIAARARARVLGRGEDDDAEAAAVEDSIEPALAVYGQQVARDCLATAERELCEQFGDSWSKLPSSSTSDLVIAEVLRADLEGYQSQNPAQDFAAAVISYSRALESALLERLFLPLRESGSTRELIPRSQRATQHAAKLNAFVAGEGVMTLGSMAFCLRDFACRNRPEPDNGFSRALEELVVDLGALCERDQFPQRLMEFNRLYRNRAAHTDRLTLQECLDARRFLLEEPTELLVVLARQLAVAI